MVRTLSHCGVSRCRTSFSHSLVAAKRHGESTFHIITKYNFSSVHQEGLHISKKRKKHTTVLLTSLSNLEELDSIVITF